MIVDDYFLAPCAQAVNEFRARHGIAEPILPIDGMGAYWRRDR
ncbi:MAG: TylF/MycF family methyltransferase [Xanthobacteraceae bacterium]|nr:TylF/MycF family methyltransferase [Xanthobacteraceae bacterium]